MPISQDLLDILVCPETKAPLVLEGETLVSTDPRTRRCYTIKDDIPIMLIDESIDVHALTGDAAVDAPTP